MNQSQPVLKREKYRPQLEDGTKLKPVPGFTEGKIYSILGERAIDRCPDVPGFHTKCVSYLVRDDNGNVRHVDNHYFSNEAKLLERPPFPSEAYRESACSLGSANLISEIDIMTEIIGLTKEEAAVALKRMKKSGTTLKRVIEHQAAVHRDASMEMMEMVDLRRLHENGEKSGNLSWGGIDMDRKLPEAATLGELTEIEANPASAELRILSGLKRKSTPFDKINKLLESLRTQFQTMENQLKEIEFETRMLKKMTVDK
jgi:hypothetical protein